MINLDDYNDQSAPAEWLEYYQEGGYFPIYIGDFFGENERYEILNKAGIGGFSLVWAARDHEENRYVSVKVIKADQSENNKELAVLQRLQQAPSHEGLQHLPQLFDHFYVERCGKKCLFLITELLGPNIHDMFYGISIRPEIRSRSVTKQLLLAIDCLHSNGIVHGDIHEGNILFRLPASYNLPLDIVYKGEVLRNDGAPLEEELPDYVVVPMMEDQTYPLGHDWKDIVLIDFSSTFYVSDSPTHIDAVPNMTPPERIFRKSLSSAVDIWTLGCMTYQFATGSRLLSFFGDSRRLIPAIYEKVGESAADWLLTSLLEAIHEGLWKDECTKWFPKLRQGRLLEDHPRRTQISDHAFQFIRKCLVVDPTKRPAAGELQNEKWVV
ncbi:kinase-like domain-containing protein [Lophiotrema nucula]|uniref:Kinase-like domain-containing protein n=1 Tax=Lophiotrema nucula TaxID=690887 RepID=A0A6A5YQR7_9PLEO|nr:kinase-like domain-containing protein [Lophiotrema nucula]